MLLYFYRAIDGSLMPVIENERTEADLRKEFAESATPLVAVITIASPEVRTAVRTCLEGQLSNTPVSETGLLWNLQNCLTALSV